MMNPDEHTPLDPAVEANQSALDILLRRMRTAGLKELSLLNSLRNQAVLAIRQSL